MKVIVLEYSGDRIAFDCTREEANELLRRRQARWEARNSVIRLLASGRAHPCRTHVSRGGPLAAMGRSQVYTTRESSNSGTPIYGFKTLYPEDRSYFTPAVVERSCRTTILAKS